MKKRRLIRGYRGRGREKAVVQVAEFLNNEGNLGGLRIYLQAQVLPRSRIYQHDVRIM
jgi:hypothetical protein